MTPLKAIVVDDETGEAITKAIREAIDWLEPFLQRELTIDANVFKDRFETVKSSFGEHSAGICEFEVDDY